MRLTHTDVAPSPANVALSAHVEKTAMYGWVFTVWVVPLKSRNTGSPGLLRH